MCQRIAIKMYYFCSRPYWKLSLLVTRIKSAVATDRPLLIMADKSPSFSSAYSCSFSLSSVVWTVNLVLLPHKAVPQHPWPFGNPFRSKRLFNFLWAHLILEFQQPQQINWIGIGFFSPKLIRDAVASSPWSPFWAILIRGIIGETGECLYWQIKTRLHSLQFVHRGNLIARGKTELESVIPDPSLAVQDQIIRPIWITQIVFCACKQSHSREIYRR